MPYQYRWEVESQVLIARQRPVKRYMMTTLGGYFPVLQKLGDGSIGAVIRSGDIHLGERGRMELVRSLDGGESWSAARPIEIDGPDPRNQCFVSLSDGTLLLAYVHAGYTNGQFDNAKGYDRVYVIRSADYGATWSCPKRRRPRPCPDRRPAVLSVRQDDRAPGRRHPHAHARGIEDGAPAFRFAGPEVEGRRAHLG